MADELPFSTRLRINLREFRTGLGGEGLWALTTMVAGALVLFIGIAAVVEKWPIRPPGPIPFRFTVLDDLIDWRGLAWFWISFVLVAAIVGWFLSRQVGKQWLRLFVGMNVVVAALLVVAVGRNVQVDAANDAARTDARQLQAILNERRASLPEDDPSAESDPEVGRAAEQLDAADAIVVCLRAFGDAGSSVASCSLLDAARDASTADSMLTQSLACLPGWTLGAFAEWATEASYDRKVAALTAVARCELDAFDPGAELGEDDAAEVADVALVAAGDRDAPAGGGQAPDDQGDEAVEARVDQDAQTQAAIDARSAVREALGTQRTEATLYEAIVDGSDGILEALSGPTDFAEFRFSGATWIFILALALFWYRKLEIRAGSQALGPVDIVCEGADGSGESTSDETSPGDDGTRSAAGFAIFKQAVVQNVPEPGAVPGAQALAPVGDLVASSEVPKKKFIGSLIDVLQTIFATRSGYVVVFASHIENEHQGGSTDTHSHVAFVRIRDRRTGQQLASMRIPSEFLDDAAHLAGYWVAGWIIARSRYVPTWAEWSETDARSFDSLQWRQGDDLPLHTRGSLDPATIDQSAVNSLILAQRAYSFQIPSGDAGPYTFNALEDFARAVNRKPRYPVARYRRVAALSALMDPGVRLDKVFYSATGEAPLPSESRFRHLFRDLLGRTDEEIDAWMSEIYDENATTYAMFPAAMRTAMLDRSADWAAAGRAGVRAGFVARLRPSERQFWKDFSQAERQGDWMKLIHTSDYIAQQRRRTPGTDGDLRASDKPCPNEALETRARQPDSHWQISYNLACLHALADGADRRAGIRAGANARKAFAWLERCLDRPHSRQLVREWAERDPDLESLRQHSKIEWERWLRRVPRLPVLIRFGDENQLVRRLQVWLDLLDSTTDLVDDGYFGHETAAAIRRFQRASGLRVDGHPDARTIAELEEQYRARLERVGSLLATPNSPSGRPVVDLVDEHGRLVRDVEKAVREFQLNCGVRPDGVPGPVTIALLESTHEGVDPNELRQLLALCPASHRRVLARTGRRRDVTASRIRRYQSSRGLLEDGVPGPTTIEALQRERTDRGVLAVLIAALATGNSKRAT